MKRVVFALLISLATLRCNGTNETCSSSCGTIRNISYPFRQKNDPLHCGDPQYELECENNQTVLHLNHLIRQKSLLKFYVKEISYERQQIRVIDPGLQQNDCSFLQDSQLASNDFSYGDPYLLRSVFDGNYILIIRCPFPVDKPSYVAGSVCRKNTTYEEYIYAITETIMRVSEIQPYCEIVAKAPTELPTLESRSYIEIWRDLLMSFNLSWQTPLSCRDCFNNGLECKEYNQERYKGNYSGWGHCGPSISSPCEGSHSMTCIVKTLWAFLKGLGRFISFEVFHALLPQVDELGKVRLSRYLDDV